MLSGAPPAANIQRIYTAGLEEGSGERGEGREGGGLAHGRTRCRAQETRAIFHHYADTMVGLAVAPLCFALSPCSIAHLAP